jgi:hypothetical protein
MIFFFECIIKPTESILFDKNNISITKKIEEYKPIKLSKEVKEVFE